MMRTLLIATVLAVSVIAGPVWAPLEGGVRGIDTSRLDVISSMWP